MEENTVKDPNTEAAEPVATETLGGKKQKKKDPWRVSRGMFIIEAALEYCIAIATGGAYLAKVTETLGMSDDLTAVLTAFSALASAVQLFSLILADKTPVKHWVTVGYIVNQCFFALIFFVPFFKISATAKIVLFAALLLLANVILKVIKASQMTWMMALVDNGKRGIFTANKEMVSLIVGMAFSFVFSEIINYFEEKGDVKNAFICAGFLIIFLMVLHTLTLVFAKEKPVARPPKGERLAVRYKRLFASKEFLLVILLPIFWTCAIHITTPFYGTWQNKELAFSPIYVAVVAAVHSVVRAVFSRPFGRLCDRTSYTHVATICLIIAGVGFGCNVFTTPENGHVMYLVYLIFYAIAYAGLGNVVTNIVFDYVDERDRTAAYALQCAVSGVLAFFVTLGMTKLFNFIRDSGNVVFGISAYPQQVLSAIGALSLFLLALYNVAVIRPLHCRRKGGAVSSSDTPEA